MDQNEKKKKKKQLPMRLNVLFLTVFILFSALILRLGIVQIVEGDMYEQQTEETENIVTKSDTPRGKIFDEMGNIIVDNSPVFNLTYTALQTDSHAKKLEIAEKLAKMIDKDTSKITERDKKDFYIITRGQQTLVDQKFTAQELEEIKSKHEEVKDADREIYTLLLERITEKDLAEIADNELEILAIKREMDRGFALSPQVIKEDLNKKEIAVISENLSELSGIDIHADAARISPYEDSVAAIIGTTKQIPKEQQDFYAVRGYDLNDYVGTSGLELQYETLLNGVKEKKKYITNKSGEPISEPEILAGESGKDLVLTLNMQFQQQLEQAVEQEILKFRGAGVDSAYAVVLDARTGGVLAMVGKKYEGGTFKNEMYGTYLYAFRPGSSIKGATILTGYEHEVLSTGEVIYDRPLHFGGTTIKKSYGGRSLGHINDIKALERSSNIYMDYIGMRIAGFDFDRYQCTIQNCTSETNLEIAINKMRSSFQQFGLGAPTGLDLPYESIGYNSGKPNAIGHPMDFSIGQFDTYTPMQLAQYASTIANNGYRLQVHLLKEVRESRPDEELGKLLYRFEPTVLNQIKVDQKYIDRVKQGFYQVTHGSQGTATALRSYPVAGKTGTAQEEKNGRPVVNEVFIGYSPYDNPEISFSIMVPKMHTEVPVNRTIAEHVLKIYENLKTTPYEVNSGIDNKETQKIEEVEETGEELQ
ncbi:penicillin-binding transpeptidase domain-containing protein [Bacillus taeanensis]|uniref:serine-type D-Ala-D-Ala carboxypeptidase n=1 Tax=Bacillus taeanensis TaxID=273032 RepID=A0A366Y4D4_9BACI|nr:penicillin-binding transpeptidase domain-containing protein [Bacillus taeanensis]RBW71244.1 penicillin-binding protein [Bacillus taeanensis]